jgi:hypothetical protein
VSSGGIARKVPKEEIECETGSFAEKGKGADFFLLSKLPFASAGGGETAGGAKDSGTAASAAAGGAGAAAGVGAGAGGGGRGAVRWASSGSDPAGSASGALGTTSASIGSGAGGGGFAVTTKGERAREGSFYRFWYC